MSDNTGQVEAGGVGGSAPCERERRVRKGPVKIRKRSRTKKEEPQTKESAGAEGTEKSGRTKHTSSESASDISEAKRQRLERRAKRRAKREERSAQREIKREAKATAEANATDEEKEALSIRKAKREQRRADRKERREKRKAIREERKAKEQGFSSKEKLAGLFDKGKTTKAEKSDNAGGADPTNTAEANKLENNIAQDDKLGAETIGAGQTKKSVSAVDRITNKLKTAAQDNKNDKISSAKDRLKGIFKKVKPKKTDEKKKAEAKAVEEQKKLTAQEQFAKNLEKTLLATGQDVNTFKTLELTATNKRYLKDVTALQARSKSCAIRVIKDTTLPESSIKTPAQNVGHIFGSHGTKKQRLSIENKKSRFPFSENLQPIMQNI